MVMVFSLSSLIVNSVKLFFKSQFVRNSILRFLNKSSLFSNNFSDIPFIWRWFERTFSFFFLNEHPWLFFFLSFFFFPSQILTCFLSPLMSFGSSFSFVAAAIKMHYSTVSCVLCFSALLILNLIKASAPISIAVVLCGYGCNQC